MEEYVFLRAKKYIIIYIIIAVDVTMANFALITNAWLRWLIKEFNSQYL